MVTDAEFVQLFSERGFCINLYHDRSFRNQRNFYALSKDGQHGILEFVHFPHELSPKPVKTTYLVWRGESGIDPVPMCGMVEVDPYEEKPVYAKFLDFDKAVIFCRRVMEFYKAEEIDVLSLPDVDFHCETGEDVKHE